MDTGLKTYGLLEYGSFFGRTDSSFNNLCLFSLLNGMHIHLSNANIQVNAHKRRQHRPVEHGKTRCSSIQLHRPASNSVLAKMNFKGLHHASDQTKDSDSQRADDKWTMGSGWLFPYPHPPPAKKTNSCVSITEINLQ